MRKRTTAAIFFAVTALILAGAGCGKRSVTVAGTGTGADGALPAVETGVRGVVLVGPTCPVERFPPDPSCAPKPLATDLVVTRNGKEVATGKSGADGSFSFKLAPGAYRISRPAGASGLPRLSERDFIVTSDGYVHVTLEADSGIR